jgi:hypothetical protein
MIVFFLLYAFCYFQTLPLGKKGFPTKDAFVGKRRGKTINEVFTSSENGILLSLTRRTRSGKPTVKFETSEKFSLSL